MIARASATVAGSSRARAAGPSPVEPPPQASSVVVSSAASDSDTTVPITCSECCIGSSRGGDLVQGCLERPRVGLTCVGGTRHSVDGAPVAGEHLLVELWDDAAGDLRRLRPVDV